MKRIFLIAFACILVLVGCASNALTWQEQYDLGVRYLNEGNYNEAIICFTAAIEIDEKNTSAYISRAHAYLKTNQMEKARRNIINHNWNDLPNQFSQMLGWWD